MIAQARDTLPSYSASCSIDSLRRAAFSLAVMLVSDDG